MSKPKNRTTATVVAAVLGLQWGLAVQAACPLDGATPFTAGSVNYNNGFAEYVEDDNGLALELCLDPLNCFFDPLDPANPFSLQIGFGAEGFWWAADTDITVVASGLSAILVQAAEAAFGGETPIDGDQFPFTRLRIRLDVPAIGFYVVTHPYGQEVYQVEVVGPGQEIRESFDIPFTPGAVNQGRVGPWLTWDPIGDAPVGFIGDPAIPHAVTGSPCSTNFLRVEAFTDAGLLNPLTIDPADQDGDGSTNSVQTDLFTVQGKLWDGVLSTAMVSERTSYARDAAGAIAQVDVFASGETAASVTFSGAANLPGGNLPLLGDGNGAFYASELLVPDGASVPSTVTVVATNAGATDPTTLIRPLKDSVIITRAEYDLADQILHVDAISSDTRVPRTLTLDGLTVDGLEVTVPVSLPTPVPPETVTVFSSAGGTDSEPVSVVDSTDSDGDGVPDELDNCINEPNGPATPNVGFSQRDTDGDGFGNMCDTDLTNGSDASQDPITNFLDLGLFGAAFAPLAPVDPLTTDADFNGDGFVDFLDYGIFGAFFMQPPGPSCCGILP